MADTRAAEKCLVHLSGAGEGKKITFNNLHLLINFVCYYNWKLVGCVFFFYGYS